VIKVEDDRIALTTIDARMLGQMRKQENAISLAMPANATPLVGDVGRLSTLVVRPPSDGVARAAAPLTLAGRNQVERELGV
jgi:hypothetical protein